MGEAFSRGGKRWLSVYFCVPPALLEDSLHNSTRGIYHHHTEDQFRDRPSQCSDRRPNLEGELVRDEVLDYDF